MWKNGRQVRISHEFRVQSVIGTQESHPGVSGCIPAKPDQVSATCPTNADKVDNDDKCGNSQLERTTTEARPQQQLFPLAASIRISSSRASVIASGLVNWLRNLPFCNPSDAESGWIKRCLWLSASLSPALPDTGRLRLKSTCEGTKVHTATGGQKDSPSI